MNATTPGKWSLSGGAFDRLLEALGPDRERAAREYESMRRRLIHFFDWQGLLSPDTQADETLDRVARKLTEGETIGNVNAYVRGVARHVLQEALRLAARERTALAEVEWQARRGAGPEDDERIALLRKCLAHLPPDSRSLILEYYHGEGRAHLVERKALAQRLGLSYTGLKSRAHRARGLLEECLRRCLQEKDPRNR